MDKSINTKRLREKICSLFEIYTYLSQEERRGVNEVVDIIRCFELTDVISSSNSICIAGMQGTGKTTLIKELYQIDDGILRISNGRGEQVPIIIKERHENQYSAYKYIYDPMKGKISGEIIEAKDVGKLSKSKENELLYIELNVPSKFFVDEGAFILLPGFEKKSIEEFDDNYNFMMNCCLSFSKAVLLVTDDQNISNSDINVLVDSLKEHGFKGSNSVFAITKCDSNNSKEKTEELKNALYDILSENGFIIDPTRIVCCGTYKDEVKNAEWIERLIEALNGNAVDPLIEKKRTYMEPLISKVLEVLDSIEARMNDLRIEKDNEAENDKNNKVRELTKENINKDKEIIEEFFNTQIEEACEEINQKIEKQFENKEIQKKLKEKYFGLIRKSLSTINDNHNEIKKICSGCMLDENRENIFLNLIIKNATSGSLPLMLGENEEKLLYPDSCRNEKIDAKAYRAARDELIESFFVVKKDYNYPTDDSSGTDEEIAELISMSFNSCFFYSLFQSEYLSEDTEIINNYLSDDITRIVRDYNKQEIKRKGFEQLKYGTLFVSALDLKDGVPDLCKELFAGISALMGTAAGPYIAVAAAALGLSCGAVLAHNKNVNIAQANQESAKNAIRNALFIQRDKILDAYDKAADKMLKQMDTVYKRKKNINQTDNRMRNAREAASEIRMICQGFYDSYGRALLGGGING